MGGKGKGAKTIHENQMIFKNLMNVAENAQDDVEKMKVAMEKKEIGYRMEVKRLQQVRQSEEQRAAGRRAGAKQQLELYLTYFPLASLIAGG